MKHPFLQISFLSLIFFACFSNNLLSQTNRINKLFDDGWKFYKGDVTDGEKENFDDNNWRNIELPHDWSIEDLSNPSDSVIGPFSKSSIGATATGYTIGGTSWYRKHFDLQNIANKKVFIYFEGVYMNSDVWINGTNLGKHPYGYTSFSYDLTPYLHQSKNVIAIRVANEGKNSRWYSGSGIYRHVWLTITNPIHVQQWGVCISTPKVSANTATVEVKTAVINELDKAAITIITRLKDNAGKTVASNKSSFPIEKNTLREFQQTVKITKPNLWSTENPYLYKTETEVWQNNLLIDRVVNTVGIRSIEFSAAKGFLLNGKKTLLRGGCMHHDNGPLGSAAIDRAEERKVELLKSYGFNAVRTSHNPPSEEFLNACDKLGLLVMDEAFDQWELPKNPRDYHQFFDEWWQKDVNSMVKRDRNHPSVIIWSIGNEIKERANASGLAIAKNLRDEVYHLDSTRPVTEAICDFWDNPGYKWDTTASAFQLLDIGGYNYMWQQYETDHAKYPKRIIMGTESFAKNALENWRQVEKHPYVIGDFVWTAMDYMGETGIGHSEMDTVTSLLKKWPWFNAYCGDIDLTGGKKPQSWYRDVVWKRRNLAMLVHAPIEEGHKEAITQWGWPDEYPSWNFQGEESKLLQVNIYSNDPLVRLELNGKLLGEKQCTSQTRLTATFSVAYAPGVLKAFGIRDGKTVDSVVLQTTGRPAKIRLTADRNSIQASRNDLSYVTTEIVDEAGHVIPNAAIPVHFSVSGNGEIAATGNGNPSEMASFKQPQRNTFRGRCLAIVRPKGAAGKIILKAEAKGLMPGEIVIFTR